VLKIDANRVIGICLKVFLIEHSLDGLEIATLRLVFIQFGTQDDGLLIMPKRGKVVIFLRGVTTEVVDKINFVSKIVKKLLIGNNLKDIVQIANELRVIKPNNVIEL
jgi:hypothetical protein